MNRISINLNDQNDTFMKNHKIWLDPAIRLSATNEHGQRRER